MLRSSAFRIGQALVTLWVTSVLVWALLLLAPGDPARTVLAARGVANPAPALIAATRRQLGLSGPVVPRYWHWLERAIHGDFGTSWQTGRPVMEEFAAHLPATVRLMITAMLIAVTLALVLGLASAATAGTWINGVIRTVTVLMVVTPGFLIGLFVLDVLVVHLNLGRVVADGSWSTVGWPAATLAIGAAGFWARVLRVSLLRGAVGVVPARQPGTRRLGAAPALRPRPAQCRRPVPDRRRARRGGASRRRAHRRDRLFVARRRPVHRAGDRRT